MLDIYDTILSNMKNTDLIKYFSTNAGMPPPENHHLIQLCKEVEEIFVEHNNICYKNDDDQTICCPFVDTNISDAGYWLSDKIPAPSFDIQQSGNLRKAVEAEAFYICIIIVAILKDDVFKNEIEKIMSCYDYTKMESNDNTHSDNLNFVNLLTSWQDLQSTIINIIVSAAKYKISDQKKESELFLRDGLSIEEQDALRDLALDIKSINFQYSTGQLSPESVKNLSKIEILELINERNNIINDKIANSKYGDLYKTMNLSSEYVDPVTKKKIFNYCTYEVEKMFENDINLRESFGDVTSVISKLKRRALKVAVNSLIRENILRYINDKEGYTLPRKG